VVNGFDYLPRMAACQTAADEMQRSGSPLRTPPGFAAWRPWTGGRSAVRAALFGLGLLLLAPGIAWPCRWRVRGLDTYRATWRSSAWRSRLLPDRERPDDFRRADRGAQPDLLDLAPL